MQISNKWKVFLTVAIILMIVATAYLFILLTSESMQCMKNPLEFYQLKTGATCNCFKDIFRP